MNGSLTLVASVWMACSPLGCGNVRAEDSVRASSTINTRAEAQRADFPRGGRVGVHGMLVFGDSESLFASHIPMEMAMHDVTLVLEIELASDVAVADEDFINTVHSIVPERLSLNDVVTGERKSFTASLYRGNFEAEDAVELGTVTVKVLSYPVSGAVLKHQDSPWLHYQSVGTRHMVLLPSLDHEVFQIVTLNAGAKADCDDWVYADPAKELADVLLPVGAEVLCGDRASASWQRVTHQLSTLFGPHYGP